MGEDFSNHPKSINDIRSDKSGKSEDWTPRDALVALLRDIDSGKQDVDQIVIVYAVKKDADAHFTKSFCAGPFTTYACMGLLHDAAIRMHDRDS